MLWAHLNVCVRSVSCPSPALHHDFTMFLLDAFGCAGLPVHSPKSIFAWGGLKHRESLNKLCCPRVVGRRPWALASPGAAVQALYLGLCSVLAHGDTVAWPGMLGMVLWHHGGAAGILMVAVGCEELGGAAVELSRSHLGSTGGEPAQGRRPCPCSMDPSLFPLFHGLRAHQRQQSLSPCCTAAGGWSRRQIWCVLADSQQGSCIYSRAVLLLPFSQK